MVTVNTPNKGLKIRYKLIQNDSEFTIIIN